MAIYQWVGGHTGYTGPGSGYDIGSELWVHPISGAVSASGDSYFGPYWWGNVKNWKQVISPTGQYGLFSYVNASTLPRGGDTVWFKGGYSGTSGSVNTYAVSCKYGGMSGDGVTASGLTSWAGGWTSSTDRFNPITFLLEDTFKPQSHPHGLETGEIGVGANFVGDFSSFNPLNVRVKTFSIRDTSSSESNAVKIALNNVASGATSDYGIMNINQGGWYISPFDYGVVFLRGQWEEISQYSGSVFTETTTNNNGGRWSIYSYPVRFSSSKNSNFGTFTVQPISLRDGGYIWGSAGSAPSIRIFGWGSTSGSSTSTVTVGNLGDGGSSSITLLEMYPGASFGPTVKFGSCIIDSLNCVSGNIQVSELATRNNSVVIRDGRIRQGTIDMAHPFDPTWQQFILGYSPSDEGFRIDDNSVVIKGYPGVNLKTATPETPNS